jgi:hypothetical protein
MTTLLALRFVEIGSVISLALLWTALATLFVAILRRSRRQGGRPPHGL